jgi:L-ascorbate peroxidase
LQYAVDAINDIKEDGNHITALLSYADLIQLGGYAAVEYTRGPTMIFRMGRVDADESEINAQGRLPDPHEGHETILQKMTRMGFNKQDFVAIMGSHTLGFAHQERSGFQGRWTQNPHVFDNSYYKEVLLGERSRFLHTPGEAMLLRDPEMKNLVDQYAQDQNLFFDHYAQAHIKMSDFGQEENLLSEFENNDPKTN